MKFLPCLFAVIALMAAFNAGQAEDSETTETETEDETATEDETDDDGDASDETEEGGETTQTTGDHGGTSLQCPAELTSCNNTLSFISHNCTLSNGSKDCWFGRKCCPLTNHASESGTEGCCLRIKKE